MKRKKQLENGITLVKELMVRRKKKMLNLVLIAAETGNSKQECDKMLAFEKDLFEDLMKCIDSSDKRVSGILNGGKTEESKNELVVFTENVEEFMKGR